MKKILLSIASVAIVGGVAFAATSAFFSDTETSSGNVLSAGAIDLLIDNESYVTDETGILVASPETSWDLTDLTIQKFFNFTDIKPGTIGEDTISIHVNDNNAWLCAAAQVTENSDVDCSDPELDDDSTCAPGDPQNGELAAQVNFAFWHDDGDNVLENGEVPFLSGPISGLNGAGKIALADMSGSAVLGNTPITGGTDVFIGKAWCFGTLTAAPVAQGEDTSPLARGTGFTCDGALVNNAAQTDRVTADLQFYAVQSRNNTTFTCAANYNPVWPQVVQRPTVGALLSAYEAPTTECDVTVGATGNFGTIQAAIDDTGTVNGETVCVDDGVYGEDVLVNKEITLAGAGASATSTINGVLGGQTGAVGIAANNVSVRGFQINAASGAIGAMRFLANLSGANIAFNKIVANGNTAVDTQGGQSNHTFSNNLFEGNATGSQLVYVNGLASVSNVSTNVDFLNNTFGGSANMALGQEAGASDVKLNKFLTVTSFTDVEDWGLGNLYNQNNFNDAGLNLQHSENGNTGENGITNAENNWWGDGDPSDGDVNLNVDVDFVPFEGSAFPEN